MLKITSLAAGLAVALFIPASYAASVPLTSITAPDAVSRQVLSAPLARIDQGVAPGADATAIIHQNFPLIIEQNFARLDEAGTAALIDNLSDAELADLAQHYNTANADSGHTDRLLDILATRLDNNHLVRLSHHFGYTPVYAALLNNAPQLATTFSATATATDIALPAHTIALNALAVTPNAFAFGAKTLGAFPNGKVQPQFTFAPILRYRNWTPGDVYLDLRTAPVGSLGVFGALVETGSIYYGGANLAWAAGQTAGGYLNTLMQTYAPHSYTTLGGTIDQMYQNYQGAVSEVAAGNILAGIATLFGTPSVQTIPMSVRGGDYSTTQAWEDANNSTTCPQAKAPPVSPEAISPEIWATNCN